MTDKQINAAIAEACGWGFFQKVSTGEILGKPIREQGPLLSIPDYCTDLNAMHEAEKVLFPFYATVYANKLARVTGADYSDDTDYFCATARQRAEAFLRSLGKWEATDKDSLTVQPPSNPR